MEKSIDFLGCFVSGPSVLSTDSQSSKEFSRGLGELFRSYIWGVNGIKNILKKFQYSDYGSGDLKLILFQFYLNPLTIELNGLTEIGNYKKKECSIGIPIIVTSENFFNQSELGRRQFFKRAILAKLDLLEQLVAKKKIDCDVNKLKIDFENEFLIKA
ncbi:hypothetical protein ACO0K0_02270 [Undibacterium sp. SXout11W]|uniref:hypothetical protein n=1 Tax=Undibacterium sp. SXout11W TaxID=3413050 RepID=UPI003BF3D6EC